VLTGDGKNSHTVSFERQDVKKALSTESAFIFLPN
jgi:hypothetical protein